MHIKRNARNRITISLDETTLKRVKELAKRDGISFADFCRRGIAAYVNRHSAEKPWMHDIGVLEGDADGSAEVDAIVYGREGDYAPVDLSAALAYIPSIKRE
jgi:hypothetical protein